jgi:hypothetical protein
MNPDRREWKRYEAPIREILNRDWDPIGIAAESPHEYDSYIPGIIGRLLHDKPLDDLVEYLWHIESVQIGMPGARKHTESVARSLLHLRQELQRAR